MTGERTAIGAGGTSVHRSLLSVVARCVEVLYWKVFKVYYRSVYAPKQWVTDGRGRMEIG